MCCAREQYGIVNPNVAALVDGPEGGGSRLDDAPTAEEARVILDAAAGGFASKRSPFSLVESRSTARASSTGLQWPDVVS